MRSSVGGALTSKTPFSLSWRTKEAIAVADNYVQERTPEVDGSFVYYEHQLPATAVWVRTGVRTSCI